MAPLQSFAMKVAWQIMLEAYGVYIRGKKMEVPCSVTNWTIAFLLVTSFSQLRRLWGVCMAQVSSVFSGISLHLQWSVFVVSWNEDRRSACWYQHYVLTAMSWAGCCYLCWNCSWGICQTTRNWVDLPSMVCCVVFGKADMCDLLSWTAGQFCVGVDTGTALDCYREESTQTIATIWSANGCEVYMHIGIVWVTSRREILLCAWSKLAV